MKLKMIAIGLLIAVFAALGSEANEASRLAQELLQSKNELCFFVPGTFIAAGILTYLNRSPKTTSKNEGFDQFFVTTSDGIKKSFDQLDPYFQKTIVRDINAGKIQQSTPKSTWAKRILTVVTAGCALGALYSLICLEGISSDIVKHMNKQ